MDNCLQILSCSKVKALKGSEKKGFLWQSRKAGQNVTILISIWNQHMVFTACFIISKLTLTTTQWGREGLMQLSSFYKDFDSRGLSYFPKVGKAKHYWGRMRPRYLDSISHTLPMVLSCSLPKSADKLFPYKTKGNQVYMIQGMRSHTLEARALIVKKIVFLLFFP